RLAGQLPAWPADRHGGGAHLLANGFDDVYAPARLLSATSPEEAGTIDRRAAYARILWRVLQACAKCDPLAMGRDRRIAAFSRVGRDRRFQIEEPIFSR